MTQFTTLLEATEHGLETRAFRLRSSLMREASASQVVQMSRVSEDWPHLVKLANSLQPALLYLS